MTYIVNRDGTVTFLRRRGWNRKCACFQPCGIWPMCQRSV